MGRVMRVINVNNNKQDNRVYDLIRRKFDDITVRVWQLTRFDGETVTTDVELVCSTCTYVERDEQVRRHHVYAAGNDGGRKHVGANVS